MNQHDSGLQTRFPPVLDILGAEVVAIDRDAAMRLLAERLEERRFTKVTFLNAHNSNVARTDREFAEALDDFLILPDGIGVDMAAWLLHGHAFPANLNGTDFIPAFFRTMVRPMKVALLGTRRSSAQAAANAFQRLAPQHDFVFVHDGFFGPDEERAIIDRIRELKPDILLVAMGVPRQELWIARNMTERHCIMPIAVGALLDFMSGSVRRAPLWVRRLRLEWLYRLLQEPRRLARRYILGNPLFVARVIRERIAPTGGGR